MAELAWDECLLLFAERPEEAAESEIARMAVELLQCRATIREMPNEVRSEVRRILKRLDITIEEVKDDG